TARRALPPPVSAPPAWAPPRRGRRLVPGPVRASGPLIARRALSSGGPDSRPRPVGRRAALPLGRARARRNRVRRRVRAQRGRAALAGGARRPRRRPPIRTRGHGPRRGPAGPGRVASRWARVLRSRVRGSTGASRRPAGRRARLSRVLGKGLGSAGAWGRPSAVTARPLRGRRGGPCLDAIAWRWELWVTIQDRA